jgi:NAD(P)-dependent dehydrogenase (short-subunit alcohol dehydrogenase family)
VSGETSASTMANQGPHPTTVTRRADSLTVLVTGATAGIGFATAAGLARLGHTILVTGRDERRGRSAADELRAHARTGDIHFLRADHSSVGGNLELAATLVERVERLDALVNNVGGIYSERWETADGYEGTLGMNFAGPVALTRALLPLLRRSEARCVNVVSSAFAMFKGDPFADLDSCERYVGIDAYGRAKLLNVMWTQALAEREPELTVYLVNPGMAWTPSTQRLQRRAVPAWRLAWPLVRWFRRRASPEKAARAPIHLASAADIGEASGTYHNEDGRPESLPDAATDPRRVRRAWALGETLATGVVTATSSADRPAKAGS